MPELAAEIDRLSKEADKMQEEVNRLDLSIETEENRIARHTELETELKACKRVIKRNKKTANRHWLTKPVC